MMVKKKQELIQLQISLPQLTTPLLKRGYGKELKKIAGWIKISNEEMLTKVEEDRQIMKIIQ